MKDIWEKFSPTMKRNIAVGGAISAIVLVLSVFVASSENNMPDPREKKVVVRDKPSVLTGVAKKEMTNERIIARIKALEKKDKTKDLMIESLKTKLERERERVAKQEANKGMDKQDIEQAISMAVADALAQERRTYANTVKTANKVNAEDGGASNEDYVDESFKGKGITYVKDGENPFAKKKRPVYQDTQAQGKKGAKQAKKRPLKMREFTSPEDYAPKDELVAERATFIPAGSRFDGVFLNGVDAGTGKGAKKNPYPVVVRIKKEAILPNKHVFNDVKECFLLASGYGELSSERVYFRTEKISCVRDDGGVIESSIKMYAIGEDTKAGVRGRLVSKQGQLLAKTLLAGFLQGVAGAFQQQPVPAINTAPGATVSYQSLLTQDTLNNSLASGTGKALEKLAQFYLDMADQIFPILEVDALRQVSFVMTKGQSLKFKEAGDTVL